MTNLAEHATDAGATSDLYARIAQAVYDAIDEVSETQRLDEPLEKSPETVLLGGEHLDSLGFVNFVASLEENLQRTLGATVSVVDVVAEDLEHCTVGRLTDRIAEWMESNARR